MLTDRAILSLSFLPIIFSPFSFVLFSPCDWKSVLGEGGKGEKEGAGGNDVSSEVWPEAPPLGKEIVKRGRETKWGKNKRRKGRRAGGAQTETFSSGPWIERNRERNKHEK